MNFEKKDNVRRVKGFLLIDPLKNTLLIPAKEMTEILEMLPRGRWRKLLDGNARQHDTKKALMLTLSEWLANDGALDVKEGEPDE